MSLHVSRKDRRPEPFSLVTTSGQRLSTADYLGRWLYLVFHRHLA